MRSLLAIAALALLWACGSSPAGPSPQPALPPPPPPPLLSWAIGGQIVETLTSQPVSGASLSFASGASATASASGDWQLQGTGTAVNQAVSIAAPGYVTRETTVRWDAAGRPDVRLDLIAERSPFSLQFYREFARNGFDEPEAMRSLRRWVRTPNFYIDTRNPKTGGTLLPSEVADIERSLREAVPQITGGQFSAGAIESGAAAFTPRADYIEVVIIYEPEATFCADAFVAANPGRIRLNYDRCPSSCGAYPPETIVHEVGHAMGFWHHSGNGILNPNRLRICSNRQFSDLERQHARIAYSRPSGNMDPDRDPGSFLAIDTDRPVRVACR